MSWLKAIEKVCARAAVGTAPQSSLPSTAAVAGRLAPALSRDGCQLPEKQKQEGQQKQHRLERIEVGASTAALRSVSDTWGSALAVVKFSQSGLRGGMQFNMQHLPFVPAVQCIGILLEAGQVNSAVELMRRWEHQRETVEKKGMMITVRAKIRATGRLRKALKTLGAIKDVEALRATVSVFHQSLVEQQEKQQQQQQQHRFKALTSSASSLENESYPFLSALGIQRTRVLLVQAVHELVMQDETVVPVYEKLTWINATAKATARIRTRGAQGCEVPRIIPFVLQKDFGDVIVSSSSYDENILRQIDLDFLSGFVHPTQCSPAEILSMPLSEVRYLYKGKDAVCLHPTPAEQTCQVASLANAICDSSSCSSASASAKHYSRRRIPNDLTEEQSRLREFLTSQISAPRSLSRRMWSCALLRHPRLLCRLNISPLMVFCSSALTFRSYEVNNSFVRCCMLLLRRLRRMGQDEKAARLVWNHLSVDSPALAVIFKKHPLAMEDAVVVVCRTMRVGVGMRRETWMGHRSLAVLRVASAAGLLTPEQCIHTCAAALDCGVHFATVQQLVREVYRNDSDTGKWILNMVRLATDSHATSLIVPLERPSHSTLLKSLLKRHTYEFDIIRSPPSVKIRVPSRSKLLALWTMVNDDVMSVSFRRLVCRLFLDGEALMEYNYMDKEGGSGQQDLDGFFREEVLASILANCTRDNSYMIFMDALLARRRLRSVQRCRELLLSEIDDESGHVVLPSLAIENASLP